MCIYNLELRWPMRLHLTAKWVRWSILGFENTLNLTQAIDVMYYVKRITAHVWWFMLWFTKDSNYDQGTDLPLTRSCFQLVSYSCLGEISLIGYFNETVHKVRISIPANVGQINVPSIIPTINNVWDSSASSAFEQTKSHWKFHKS